MRTYAHLQNLIRQGTGSAALLKVALLASHMLVVCFSFAVLLLWFVSHVISCTFLLFLSSVCLLHLPCVCSHWLSLTLLQVAWLSFGFASALLRLAFAFLWLCLCLAWLHSGFALDFVFACFALLWLRLGCGLIWAFALALLGLLFFSLADFE